MLTVYMFMHEQEDPQILNDQINLLYRSAIPGIAATVIASAGLAFGFKNQSISDDKLLWWLCLSVLMVLRSFDTFLWLKRSIKGIVGSKNDLYRYSSGAILTAFFWTFFCLFFYNSLGINELFSALVIVSAMAGGASTILSGHKLVSQTYMLLLLVPFSIQMIIGGNPAHQMLGYLGLAYAFVMFSIAKTAADFTKHSIMLRNEHSSLLKNMEQQVEKRTQEVIELSQHDPLTHLLNRRAFITTANQQLSLMKQKVSYAIFFIDLDKFKLANDNFGHKVGDEVLCEVAKRIKQACKYNEIICRWGGDEFIILAHQTSHYRFTELAITLKRYINLPIVTSQHVINMDCSIGIATYPEHGQSLSDLISLADLSMYSRKGGENSDYVMFSGELKQKIKYDMHLSKGIARAVSEKQLHLVYQPIIESTTGEIATVEALLRWDFEGELISPEVFIPLAEKNGAIKEIGYWVIEESMRRLTALQKINPTLQIAINVSVIQFEDANFVNKVYHIVRSHNVAPNNVHIEITESVFSSDKLYLINMVRDLQALGFQISIDDFGTGYSSLSVIQDLDINFVKIDRSFITNLHLNGIDIVKAVMVMSHGLRYRVIAEGVEDLQQANALTALGIHYLQGYLFDKPLEFEILEIKLQRHSGDQLTSVYLTP